MQTIQSQFLQKALGGISEDQREMFMHGFKSACEVLRISGGDGPVHARAAQGALEVYLDEEAGAHAVDG